MFKTLVLTLILTLTASCHRRVQPKPSPVPVRKTAIELQHGATHKISLFIRVPENPDDDVTKPVGHCSGTVIGPHAILLAAHCTQDSDKIRLDNEILSTKIDAELPDGNDHVIYIVDRTFSTWVHVTERQLSPNEAVHFWGAPKHLNDVWRDGYFMGVKTPDDLGIEIQSFVLPVYPGDSGSGIFDKDGNVVAVVSMGLGAEEWSLPLNFTVEQLAVALK